MLRGKPALTTNHHAINPHLQHLQKSESLKLKRGSSSGSMRRKMSLSTKRKQKRDIEQLVTLGEAYLIIHLCAGEVVLRGLTESDIFRPIRIGDGADEVRYLINCLLRDNRSEFEDELKFQNIHNVIAGMRWTMKNCTSKIVPYECYEEFVRYEQEWQYDPRKGSFNQFLSYLPRQNKGILVELFDLFAMTMEQSHFNNMHPTRILKSMSLHIFNEVKTKTYENFLTAYQEWLKYSHALIHLFLAYLRERACSTQLPERLHLLLQDYVECRKKCLMNSSVSGDGREIIASQHSLPDITISDLDEVIRSRKQIVETNNDIKSKSNSISRQSSMLRKTKTINTNKSNRSSLADIFPELLDSLSALKRKASFKSSNIVIIDDPRTAESKWDELQNKGLGIMSEEVLKLFFAYDDRDVNPNTIRVKRKKSDGKKKRNGSQLKNDRFEGLPPLPKIEFVSDPLMNSTDFNDMNNDSSSSDYPDENSIGGEPKWDSFRNRGFRESIDNSSNIFSLSSTLGPSSSNIIHNATSNGGSTVFENTRREESQEVRNRRPTTRRKTISFLCVKRRPPSVASDSSGYMHGHTYEDWEDWHIIDQTVDMVDSSHLSIETIDALFPYVWIEANVEEQDEQWGEWVFIEPRRGLIHECEWVMIEERNRYMSEWEQNLNNTNNLSLSNNYPHRMSALSNFSLPWVKSSKSSKSSGKRKSDASSALHPPSALQQYSRSNNSSFSRPYLPPPGTPNEQMDKLLNQPADKGQEFRDRYIQQQQEEEESKLYQIQKYQQEQQMLIMEQQEERKRRERERLLRQQQPQEAQNQDEDDAEVADQYYQDDVYDQYRDDEQTSEYQQYEEEDNEQSKPVVQSQYRQQLQKQRSQQQFIESPVQKRPSRDELQSTVPRPQIQKQGRPTQMQGRQSPKPSPATPSSLIPGKQSPYSGVRGRESPYPVSPQIANRQPPTQGRQSPSGIRGRKSPMMTNAHLPARQGTRPPPSPSTSDQMSQMTAGRSSPMGTRNTRKQQSPVPVNAKLPNQSPVIMNASLPPNRQPPMQPRQNAQLQQYPLQQYQQPYPQQQIGYPQKYPPPQYPTAQYPQQPQQYQQYPQQYRQQYGQQPPPQPYPQPSAQPYPQPSAQPYPQQTQPYPPQPTQQYQQQYPQQSQQSQQNYNNGMEVGVQQVSPLMNTINTSGGPIITQTTTNKIQTSRKILNNNTSEETVVQYENVTVSTTQSSVRMQQPISQQNLQQHQQKYESNKNDDGNTRSPTESEIIEGYTVPLPPHHPTQEQKQEVSNQVAPYQPPSPQMTAYNPPGTFGPYPLSYSTPPSPNMGGYTLSYSTPPSPIMGSYPVSYSPTPPSPKMNPYIDAQRRSFELPASIQSNLPPEFFKQPSQLYNNLPPQIPMSIPFDAPAQQLYLKYPTSASSSPQQQPYFPSDYVPAENDRKGKGKAKISKTLRIGN
ncbi:10573_t:CDS:2 [Funneliformis geosporum]|nr:10573_t:CDS:2 [Funneliformis geosporum]